MDPFCYVCVSVILSSLFLAGFWSPAGKWLVLALLYVLFSCVFVTFPHGVLSKEWCLFVFIPDLCPLSYFYRVF